MRRRLKTHRALSFNLDPHAPLQEQVYRRVREAIADGRLSAGERLPSTRSLSAQLNLARGTVDAAFSRLADEGLILSRGAAGTVVTNEGHRLRLKSGKAPVISSGYAPPDDFLWPLRGGLPALDLFPRAIWSSLAVRCARDGELRKLCYPDPRGLADLREAIATHLLVSRGVACEPSQIFVTSGYQSALQLVTSLVTRVRDEVWFEDPGYRFARNALERAGRRLGLIPVDGEGMDVHFARRTHPSARLAVVTPGHQSPLGVMLSPRRRQALLTWAHDEDSWIVEDDYDSEFHYRGRKPPALKSMDHRDRVFYAGSFSKTLFPALRLGYFVAPARWVADAAAICEMSGRGLSVHDQTTVAAFLQQGHFSRHLRRMRLRYAERSKALVSALNQQFGRAIRIEAPEGGLTLLATFRGRDPDTDLVARARAHGMAPAALSAHAVRHRGDRGLLMGFTNVRSEDAMEVAGRLKSALNLAGSRSRLR
jgi:GntR family transcriptional regulator / MocR family aminotransferase